MSFNSRALQGLVWVFLILVMLSIGGAFLLTKLAPGRVGPAKPLPVYGQVADFTLTNQSGQSVSIADLRGQVWVADIIFTRCAGPCPEMTGRLSQLQSALPAGQPVKLITLTTDPEFDMPAVLKQYAERFHAAPGRWHFLTGTKRQIADLAIGGLKLTALEKQPGERETDADLFIHSTISVIVDRQGRLRGTFETLEPEFQPRILAAIRQLLREK